MQNIEQLEAEIKANVDLYLGHCPDAIAFLLAYCRYCHKIDDIIDEKITNPEFILETTDLACQIFNCNFWRQYAGSLYVTERLINNDYADSVAWEKSQNTWEKNQADVLRNTANQMTFAVILLICGRDALRKLSSKIRTHSHFRHHDSEGKPI